MARGDIGDLLVSGPTAAAGYWNNRQRSRATFLGEWTRTGDKYFEDEDGYYVYCGRSDDMLKVSGMFVSPAEVEAVLVAHDDVLEAAVVGAADHDGLIKPKAFVVAKPGVAPGDGLARGLDRACEEPAAGIQMSALDRVSRRAAKDRNRQNPALQAARRHRAAASLNGAPSLSKRSALTRIVLRTASRRGRACARGYLRLF